VITVQSALTNKNEDQPGARHGGKVILKTNVFNNGLYQANSQTNDWKARQINCIA
jgi:hypothetical protein